MITNFFNIIIIYSSLTNGDSNKYININKNGTIISNNYHHNNIHNNTHNNTHNKNNLGENILRFISLNGLILLSIIVCLFLPLYKARYSRGNPYVVPTEQEMENEENCPICLEELEGVDNSVRIRVCTHILCRTCADRLLDNFIHNCPVCRRGFYIQQNQNQNYNTINNDNNEINIPNNDINENENIEVNIPENENNENNDNNNDENHNYILVINSRNSNYIEV